MNKPVAVAILLTMNKRLTLAILLTAIGLWSSHWALHAIGPAELMRDEHIWGAIIIWTVGAIVFVCNMFLASFIIDLVETTRQLDPDVKAGLLVASACVMGFLPSMIWGMF